MINQTVQIKKTSMEPQEFRGVSGRIVRETVHGYVVVQTTDGREIIIHPKSVRALPQ